MLHNRKQTRREFYKRLGISAAAAHFLTSLPSMGFASQNDAPKKRLIIVFTPNGVVPSAFWPDAKAETFELPRILQPLLPWKDQVLTLHGLCNQIRGDGDGHMRGIGCLLTGIELFPGDVQGGSDTPAGWSMGISVDQYLKSHLQKNPATQTRFGSLELGLMVPRRADTWTRMCYSGPNQPVAPIDNPYKLFDKLYGNVKNRALVASVLDDLSEDFSKVESMLSADDRQILQEHQSIVRAVEKELQADLSQGGKDPIGHAVPEIPPNVQEANDNMPQISKMQIDLLVSGLLADSARIATYQITNSVGQPRMKWLGIDEGHHSISHEPDSNATAVEQLIRINEWYCGEVAYLTKRLAETPEPGGDGTLLDHTTIIWTNELGVGNTHSRDHIPFVLIGGGIGYKMGRAQDFGRVPHNRFLMNLCEAFDAPVNSFGNPDFCKSGVLSGLT